MKRLGAGRTLGRGKMKARSEIGKDQEGREARGAVEIR